MTAIPKPSKVRKESRPTRDEFELMELGEKLNDAKENKKQLLLMVWKRPDPIKGRIVELNTNTRNVHVQTAFDGLYKVPFIDIMKAVDIE